MYTSRTSICALVTFVLTIVSDGFTFPYKAQKLGYSPNLITLKFAFIIQLRKSSIFENVD